MTTIIVAAFVISTFVMLYIAKNAPTRCDTCGRLVPLREREQHARIHPTR